ncbi:MAG: hypothetical protein OEZ02_05390 [Anaerolineae bacterium]|nr:hypothetical protein [Anaerolineae bacterium]
MQITNKLKSFFFSPAGVTFLASTLLAAITIASAGGDPLELARIGTQYSQADPDGTQGYDGQFVYYIARDPNPAAVAPLLDNPAYRYQRILLPLLARLLSFGSLAALPWVLAAIGILSHTFATALVTRLLTGWGAKRWYALIYGLWVGFLLAVRLDLPEPLAYGLVAAAMLAQQRGRPGLSWLFYALAVFAKEVTLIFLAAQLLHDLWRRRWTHVIGLGLVGLLPFALFQLWLWHTFGALGINSGGAMSTPFEPVPFMGLFRTAAYSKVFLAALVVVYAPAVIWPTLWAISAAVKRWRTADQHLVSAALLLNALVIPFTPFSTFREPGGMLRFSSGLVMALLLYAGRYRLVKVLNYAFLWLALNALLFN